MEFVVIIAIVACLATILGILYHRLIGDGARLPVTAEWIDDLSVDRYRPMLRLLDKEDLSALQDHSDYSADMAARFRRERCRIFQGYLRCLRLDFQRVSMALKIVLVQSRYDRPDLAAALVRTQRAFAFGLVLVYCRLALYRFGLATVDVADVLKAFDGARLELRSLVPAQDGMAA